MIPVTSLAHPTPKLGKRSVSDLYQALPYEDHRVALVCSHNPSYGFHFYPEQPPFCGLCFFREGVESEIPGRIHQYRVLADNGNPETSPKFMAHLQVVMGLEPPKSGESLQAYRKRRIALAREQYTARSPLPDHHLFQQTRVEKYSSPSPRLFPVTSALWKLMGYQPPLGRVLIQGVNGRTEWEIASQLSTSVLDIYVRMVKAIRVGMGFIPNDNTTGTGISSRGRGAGGSQEAGTDESGLGDPES